MNYLVVFGCLSFVSVLQEELLICLLIIGIFSGFRSWWGGGRHIIVRRVAIFGFSASFP